MKRNNAKRDAIHLSTFANVFKIHVVAAFCLFLSTALSHPLAASEQSAMDPIADQSIAKSVISGLHGTWRIEGADAGEMWVQANLVGRSLQSFAASCGLEMEWDDNVAADHYIIPAFLSDISLDNITRNIEHLYSLAGEHRHDNFSEIASQIKAAVDNIGIAIFDVDANIDGTDSTLRIVFVNANNMDENNKLAFMDYVLFSSFLGVKLGDDVAFDSNSSYLYRGRRIEAMAGSDDDRFLMICRALPYVKELCDSGNAEESWLAKHRDDVDSKCKAPGGGVESLANVEKLIRESR